VLASIVEEQCLGATLAFVVAAADAYWIYAAPVRFGLRVHFRVAVDLAGGCLKNAGADALGQAQHIDRTVHAGLGGLYRIVLVMHWRGGAGQIEDPIDFDVERKGYVMTHQLKPMVVHQLVDVAFAAGIEIVYTQDVFAALNQPVAQMRPKESGATGNEYFRGLLISHVRVLFSVPTDGVIRETQLTNCSGIIQISPVYNY
jgi:hypothetical protein